MTSSRHIRTIVQSCFDRSHERMKADELEEDASDLRTATVHWLRHTGISEDVKFRPREHVRDYTSHQPCKQPIVILNAMNENVINLENISH